MFRIASIIAVILLGTLSGCRSVPRTTVADSRSGHGATCKIPRITAQQPESGVRSVAFVHEAEKSNESELPSEPPELLPTPIPDARPDAPLTLTDLEGIAFQSNPTLAAAAARMEAARGRQVQVSLYPNPVVGYHATEIGNLGTAGQQGGFISQRFITGGKLRLDRAIAGKEIDEAHWLFHAQEQRVLSDVRVRFYDALVAQKRVQLTQELARIGDEVVSSSKNLLEGRQISENVLLQAEIEAEQSHILLDDAKNQNSEEWRRLAAVIGIPAMKPTPLAGKLDTDIQHYDWEDCYSLALAENPELIAAQTRVDRARISITRAHKQNIPDIDVSVSVRHHNVTNSDVANVQAGFPIPILDRNQGNILRSESKLVEAINEVKRIELDLQDRLAVAYRRYTNARQQVERYSQKMVPKAERSLKLVKDGYEKGQAEYLTLLTAQQTYVQVSLSHLESLRELRASSAVIEGQLLTGSLTKRR